MTANRAAIYDSVVRLFGEYPQLLAADDSASPPESADLTRARESLAALILPLHEADIADLLEALPLDRRRAAWSVLPPERTGAVLVEASESVAENLLEEISEAALARGFAGMDINDVAALLRGATPLTRARLMRLAGLADHPELRASLSFDEDSIGGVMDFQPETVRAAESVGQIRERLQRLGELPSHCDKLFVLDESDRLVGVLPLKRLLLNTPEKRARDIMVGESIRQFSPADSVESAADAFERYDLISAPVVDGQNKIIGRVTIDEILNHVQSERERGLLSAAGLAEDEDLFAPLARRMRNRWIWIGINLLAAFFVSRVVGAFEGTIEKLAALASLMPIVAGMSGNIGNQTATLIIRALALGQFKPDHWRAVLKNELALGAVNGALWGGFAGLFAYGLYENIALAMVLMISMLLGFIVAAAAGFWIPLLMQKLGRDPALGATVVLTAVTDSMGFFIFLGLGAAFLF